MITFLIAMAVGFIFFTAGLVTGTYLALRDEKQMTTYSDTWNDPIDVYIPVTRYAIPYDHEERGDLA